MRTLTVDPVSAALLTTRRPCDCRAAWGHAWGCASDAPPFLSFVTVDRPPPDGWIGQRVAIYAGWMTKLNAELAASLGLSIDMDHVDAIVGSGTLAEALPILTYKGHTPHDGPLDAFGIPACIEVYRDDLLWWTHHDGGFRSIKDQLPLQSWEPGRWALRFTDVAPTSERCPWCGGSSAVRCDHAGCDAGWHWVECPVCIQDDCEVPVMPVVAPVLSGDDPIYKEWTP